MKYGQRTRRSHFTKRSRGLAAALALLLFAASTLYLPLKVNALGYVGQGDLSKIDPELLTRLDASDDATKMFQFDVRLNSIPADAIDLKLQTSYGLKMQDYENEEVFTQKTLPSFKAELEQKVSLQNVQQPLRDAFSKQVVSNDKNTSAKSEEASIVAQTIQNKNDIFKKIDIGTVERYVEKNKNVLDLYTLAKTKNYTYCRRESVKELIAIQNGSFYSNLQGKEYSIIFESAYVAAIAMEATESVIRYISTLDEVSFVYDYSNEESQGHSVRSVSTGQPDDWQTADPMQIQAAKTANPNLTGLGVTVGVIEDIDVSSGIDENGNAISVYNAGSDPNAPQLQNANVQWQEFTDQAFNCSKYGEPIVHSTLVVSIIAGQSVQGTGALYRYEGVAPDATVIGRTIMNEQTFKNALDELIALNVDVINASVGFHHRGYTGLDAYVDAAIAQHNVVVVAASGNLDSEDNPHNRVASPGNGYNVITVGNIDATSINPPYAVHPSSSYLQTYVIDEDGVETDYSWATNKPDLCAVGTNVLYYLDDDGKLPNTNEITGTSFSAPFVTGIIALMMQKSAYVQNSSHFVKPILIASAEDDTSIVSDYQNFVSGTDNAYMRTKSGAGLVNAVKALSICNSKNLATTAINLKYTQYLGMYSSFSIDAMELKPNDKVRVVMCFTKPENALIQGENGQTIAYWNNLDLFLTQGGQTLASSTSTKNNVEILEYTATIESLHRIQIDLISYVKTVAEAGDQIVRISVACLVE